MKVSTTLNVSAEYLFSRLVDNAVYDIKQETGKSISADELEGVSYKTHVDKRTPARLLITKIVKNRSYHYKLESKDEVLNAAYELVELAKDKVCVTYSESLLEKNPLAKFRLKVATKCLGWLRRYNFVNPLAKFRLKVATKCLGWLRRYNFVKLLKNFEVGY